MATPAISELLDSWTKPVLSAIGLFTAATGVAAYWASDSAVLGAVASFLIVLGAYNLALWRGSRRRSPIGAAEPARWRRRRLFLHAGSALVALLGLAAIAGLSRESTAIRMQLWALGCKPTLARMERYVAGDGRRNVPMRLKLAACYDQDKQVAAHVATLIKLREDGEALRSLPEPDRTVETGSLDAEIGLDLLTSYDPAMATDPAEAERRLREAAFLRPGDWFVRDLLGFAVAKNLTGAPDQRARSVEKILEEAQQTFAAAPGSPTSEAMYAHAYWRGRTFAAVQSYEQAEKEFTTAISLTPAGTAQADYLRVLLRSAQCNRTNDAGCMHRALSEASTPEARHLAAEEATTMLLVQAEKDMADGDSAAAARADADADAIWKDALQLGVDGDRTDRLRIALLHEHAGRHADAAAYFRELVKEEPANNFFRLELGKAARRADNPEEARLALLAYVEKTPRDAEGQYELGRALLTLAQQNLKDRSQYGELLGQAEQRLRRAAELAPTDPAIAAGLRDALIEKANGQEDKEAKARAFEDALQWTRASRTLLPATGRDAEKQEATQLQSAILNDLAYHYAERPETRQTAQTCIDEALQAEPDNPNYLDTKATVLIWQAEQTAPGQRRKALLQQAKALLDKAGATLPHDDRRIMSQYYVHTGRISQLSGDKSAARTDFQRALEYDATNAEARRLLQ